MTTVFLDAVFKPFFKNRLRHEPPPDDRSDEFPDGWRPSNHSTYGVCECKHAISNTTKGKNHTLKDGESKGAMARLWNGKWGGRETYFEQYTTTRCSTGQSPLLLKWPTQRKRMPTTSPIPTPRPHAPRAYLLSTTHSKDVRFPWVNLYYFNLSHSQGQVYQALSEIISNTVCWKHTFSLGLPFVNRNWHFS
jgi:hypothetical protein